jgi:two-component system cell cycle sensor histidine kinase/response regulator CckA
MGTLNIESNEMSRVESYAKAELVGQAFEEAPDAFVLLERGGHVVRANAQACELVELAEEEFIGAHFREFVEDEFETLAMDFWRRASEGEAIRAEIPLVGALQGQRRTEFAAKRIETGDDYIVMLVLRDITPESESVEKLQRATEKLALMEGMQLVAQLAGGLVHDLNNMLAVITSYGQLLKSELADRPELVCDVEEIIEAGETASSLSRRLLSVGRQRSQNDDESDAVDLNAEIERLVSFLERVMPPRVVLETKLENAQPVVSWSSMQLEQVLLNLILNARDAVCEDGVVRVETDLRESRGEDFEPAFVEVRVVDNGEGIPEDKLERIFEPFFTTKDAGEGTGMGLSMVKRIVEDAGGSVHVDSVVGKGTTMTVRLPTSTSNGSDVGIEESTLVTDEHGSERVLVVDGNASSRRLIQRVLAGNGYDVLVAEDQERARKILVNEFKSPALVILDARPNHPQAMKFSSELMHEHSSIRFIYTVGNGAPECERDEYVLERPITPSSLASRVRLALDAD